MKDNLTHQIEQEVTALVAANDEEMLAYRRGSDEYDLLKAIRTPADEMNCWSEFRVKAKTTDAILARLTELRKLRGVPKN